MSLPDEAGEGLPARSGEKVQNMTRKLASLAALGGIMLLALAGMAQSSPVPLQGPMNLNVGGISFDPIPWVSPTSSKAVYLYPFLGGTTLNDYSGNGLGFNLGEAQFLSGSINVSIDDNSRTDYLGIRIVNLAGEQVAFGATKVTLDIADQGAFDLWLPDFTFNVADSIHFWVATDGSTYYANSSKGPGAPDMLPTDAMVNEYKAAVPEPATMSLLALGGLALLKRRRNA